LQEKNDRIKEIYYELLDFYGPQGWWPGETRLEVIVGAILTQNVSWKNVEKSIINLKKEGLLNINSLLNIEDEKLYTLIKSSGYFRQKAKRLKDFLRFINDNYGRIEEMINDRNIREKILNVKGIGKETADSILLYALDLPFFVVDTYTLRIFKRMGLIEDINLKSYEEIRIMVENSLDRNVKDLKEFHALLVEHGKKYCKKEPLCDKCPINKKCRKNI
jgi:endonuclease-3 related protein